MTDTNTLEPSDAPDLLQIARSTGLRSHLQGVSATDARALLKAFVDALPPTPASQPAAAPSGPVRVPLLARALAEWHEEDGYAAWWATTNCGWASEPAWIGTPLSSDWPGYHTHWTPHPEIPCDPSITAAPKGGEHAN